MKAPTRAFPTKGCEDEVPPRVRYPKPGKFGVKVEFLTGVKGALG